MERRTYLANVLKRERLCDLLCFKKIILGDVEIVLDDFILFIRIQRCHIITNSLDRLGRLYSISYMAENSSLDTDWLFFIFRSLTGRSGSMLFFVLCSHGH